LVGWDRRDAGPGAKDRRDAGPTLPGTSTGAHHEVDLLAGDPSKAKRVLGWAPEGDFHGLIRMMVEADLKRLRKK
jgi:nucleoside-diphosphate-sugar epimerase